MFMGSQLVTSIILLLHSKEHYVVGYETGPVGLVLLLGLC
jgi:hypothetical protein